MTDEKRIAALREEIRGAGAALSRYRLALDLVGLGTVPLLAILAFARYPVTLPAIEALLIVLCLVAVTWILCYFPLLLGVLRAARRRRISRQLSHLSRSEAAFILLPLRGEGSSEARWLVGRLLRELHIPAELAPATPDARGDERSPAERSP